jgi:hypothetical protein
MDKNQDPGSGINIPGSATLALVLDHVGALTSFHSMSSQNQRKIHRVHLREDEEGDEEKEEPVDEAGQRLCAYIAIAELLVGAPL